MNHLKTLFSSRALKAWVAGLVAVLSAYLAPIISDWLTTLTPEQVNDFFGGQLPYGVAAVLLGAVGVVWTYLTKNKPA